MQGHATGPIQGSRQGALPVHHSVVFDYTSPATATAKKLITIKASATQPVALRTVMVIMTQSNAAVTHTLDVGIDAGAGITAILSGVDGKGVAGVNYAPANPIRVLTTDTDIWYRQNINGATTAGKFMLLLEMAEININAAVFAAD